MKAQVPFRNSELFYFSYLLLSNHSFKPALLPLKYLLYVKGKTHRNQTTIFHIINVILIFVFFRGMSRISNQSLTRDFNTWGINFKIFEVTSSFVSEPPDKIQGNHA
jgi:hypothetical protein